MLVRRERSTENPHRARHTLKGLPIPSTRKEGALADDYRPAGESIRAIPREHELESRWAVGADSPKPRSQYQTVIDQRGVRCPGPVVLTVLPTNRPQGYVVVVTGPILRR
jgi:hypothetical protein